MSSMGMGRGVLSLLVAVFAGCAASAEQGEEESPPLAVDTAVRPSALAPPIPGPISPCLAIPGPINAPPPGPGDIDRSFGCNGLTTYGSSTGDFQVRALAVQPDDKMVAVGSVFTQTGNTNDVWIARYTSKGALDSTFADGGVLVYNFTGVVGGAESGEAVVVQPDGHLIVGGGYTPEDGSARKAFLMRLDANGALDPGFGSGGTVTMTTMTFVNALALQGSALVAAGERCSFGDSSCVTAVGRFSGTTAAVESGFGMNGIYTMPFGGAAPSRAYALLTTSTKMFVGGATTAGASTDATFARYDGLPLDSTFGPFGVQTFGAATQDAAYGLAPYGTKYYAAEGDGSFAVRRVLGTGAGDTAFGVQGRRSVAFAGAGGAGGAAYGVVVSSSTVVAAGTAYTSTFRPRMALARFTSSGTLDTAFSDDGQLLLTAGGDDAFAHAVVRQSTGRLVVGGWSRKDGAKKRAAVVRVYN